MTSDKQFSYTILRILDCGFTVDEIVDTKSEAEAQIGYGMNFSFNIYEGWVQYLLKAEYRTIENQKTFITGTVLTKFHVLNLTDYIEEEGKVSFPNGSLEALFEVSFSHLRAILGKNLIGTLYSEFFLPAVAPLDIFTGLLQDSIKMHKSILEQYKDVKDATLIPSQGL